MNKKFSLKIIKTLALIIILIFSTSYQVDKQYKKSFIFFCRVDTINNPSNRCININWNEIEKQISNVDPKTILVRDLSNNKDLRYQLVDSNNDKKIDFLSVTLDFIADDPLKTVEISVGNSKYFENVLSTEIGCKSNLIATKLISADLYIRDENNFSWPDTIASSIIKSYPDPSQLEIYSPGQWSYTNGFFINAICELYAKNNNNKYKNYAQQWLNSFVNNDGIIDSTKYNYRKFELDDILPGRALIEMYQYTGEEKYKKASDQLIKQLINQPITSEGGFWHKKVYKQQMWLDGIYMGDVFLAQYGKSYDRSEYIDKSIHQTLLIYSHTFDSTTGLLYHGWDESKNKVWADSLKGTSPEFWGRSIGWYMMAIVDILDYVPETHPDRNKLLNIFQSLSSSLFKYQDANGLWNQVVDKGSYPDNWYETSCSAMIAYAYAKGSKKGYLNQDYMNIARKTFNGLKENYIFFDNKGTLYLNGTVKVGTLNTAYSDGSYAYYVSVERRLNDFKGLVALMYLSMYIDE